MTDRYKSPTWQQNAQQRNRARAGGQYEKGPACYCCTKPAGHDYSSHQLTDCTDANGEKWRDAALVLCKRCALVVDKFTLVAEYNAYRATRQPKPKENAK